MSQAAVAEGLDSPAIAAVEQVFPNLKGKVFNYAFEDNFRKLWSLQSLPADRIVILWDRTATDSDLSPINAADCLSPLDWAAAYVNRLGGDALAWPEILILDVAPEFNSKVPTVSHFEALRSEQLPWLTVRKNPGLDDLLEWLGRTRSLRLAEANEKYSSDCRAGLDRFLREIRLNLTDLKSDGGYDRHAISNIIGPMILRGSAARKTLHSDALLQLVKACKLCAAPLAVQAGDAQAAEGQAENVSRPVDSESERESGAGLQILLVDDQAEHGWKDWIQETLPEATVRYLTNPVVLVDAVKQQLDAADSKDLRFRLQLPQIESAERPVLLLDLRLFSGSAEDELAFYGDRLLPLIDKLKDNDGLAWPSFTSSDAAFDSARRAVESRTLKLESPDHHEALSWLPRILALVDMSLPIVLFSSTERASIKILFSFHENILTGFQKPTFVAHHFSPDTSSLERWGNRLRAIVRQVKCLHDARAKCRAIESLSNDASRERTDNVQRQESLHIELYIDEDDESRRSAFSVGGTFAVFRSLEDADCFEDTCVQSKLRYFDDRLFIPSARPLAKYTQSGAPQLQDALRVFRKSGKLVALGFLRLRRGDVSSRQEMQDDVEDVCFWTMLNAVIELFYAESLPVVCEQFRCAPSAVAFSVFIGTRMAPSEEKGDSTYRGNIDVHRFRNGDIMMRSMGGRDALPIVQKVLALHQPARGRIERAVAVCLPYAEGKKTAIDRAIHRPSKTIYAFDSELDVEVRVTPPCNACGRILRRGDRYVIVAIPGLDGTVYCFWRDCLWFEELTINMPVNIEVYQDNNGALKGAKVKRVNEDDLANWLASQRPMVSSRFLDRRDLAEFRPDYRALHYIADQALRVVHEFNGSIPREGLAGQFDEDYTPALESSIIASRFLDSGQLSAALRMFCVELPANRRHHRPLARAHIAGRLWSELQKCSGSQMMAAFEGRTLEPERARST